MIVLNLYMSKYIQSKKYVLILFPLKGFQRKFLFTFVN